MQNDSEERGVIRPAESLRPAQSPGPADSPCRERKVWNRMTGIAADDAGSILPLILGYAVLALMVIIVAAEITGVYVAQRRLDGIADAAALAATDGFRLGLVEGNPQAVLVEAEVDELAAALVAASGDDVVLVDSQVSDPTTARVRVARTWHPAMLAFLARSGFVLQSDAVARTGAR